MFIFTSSSSALLGFPSGGLSIWLLLLAISNTLLWVYANLFHEKMDKTRKYSKSTIFVWYKNGHWRLLTMYAQSSNTGSFFKEIATAIRHFSQYRALDQPCRQTWSPIISKFWLVTKIKQATNKPTKAKPHKCIHLSVFCKVLTSVAFTVTHKQPDGDDNIE